MLGGWMVVLAGNGDVRCDAKGIARVCGNRVWWPALGAPLDPRIRRRRYHGGFFNLTAKLLNTYFLGILDA